MRHNFLEAFIGAVVLIAAGLFFFFAYHMGQKNVVLGYTIYALFERVDGLNTGTDIKVSGVKVGTVRAIELDPQTFKARVALTLRNDVLIPTDSSAEIASESLLGGKFVALVPGGSEKNMQAEEVITNTQSSISFEGLISKFLFSKTDESKSSAAKP